jgi:hypothetical protein
MSMFQNDVVSEHQRSDVIKVIRHYSRIMYDRVARWRETLNDSKAHELNARGNITLLLAVPKDVNLARVPRNVGDGHAPRLHGTSRTRKWSNLEDNSSKQDLVGNTSYSLESLSPNYLIRYPKHILHFVYSEIHWITFRLNIKDIVWTFVRLKIKAIATWNIALFT